MVQQWQPRYQQQRQVQSLMEAQACHLKVVVGKQQQQRRRWRRQAARTLQPCDPRVLPRSKGGPVAAPAAAGWAAAAQAEGG